jgi:hypothetical protein
MEDKMVGRKRQNDTFNYQQSKGTRRGKNIVAKSLTLRTLIPAVVSPLAWRFLNSVTVAIGLRPAFSANVNGITSNASANALRDAQRIHEI